MMLAPRGRTGVEAGGGGPGVVRDMAPGGSVDVGVEDHSLLGSYRSSHLKLTRDFILGFGPYPVLYFYPEKPREMQSSGMSMSPAVETFSSTIGTSSWRRYRSSSHSSGGRPDI